MKKEMHIWLDQVPKNCATNYCVTDFLVEGDYDIIHTTITHFLSFRYDRRLFVHVNNECHEITLGECEGTDIRIKEHTNIEVLLYSGSFRWF